jgi:hypothetical protein
MPSCYDVGKSDPKVGQNARRERGSHVADAQTVQGRRSQVGALWIRGAGARRIAETLQVPLGTIKHDLRAIRSDLVREHAESLHAQQARSIDVLRTVQVEAWRLFASLAGKDKEEARTAALRLVVDCEQRIARISGVLSPDYLVSTTTINLVSTAEYQTMRAALLKALAPYVEARIAAAAVLSEGSQP